LRSVINQYRFYKVMLIRSLLASILVFNTTILFSQDDQEMDTVEAATDRASSIKDDDFYEDSADRADYNYYDYMIYWPVDSFVMRKVPDSVMASIKCQEAFWYADRDFKNKEESRPNGGWNWMVSQKWFDTLIWTIIIGGFASVIIWFLINSNVRLFSKKVKTIYGGDQIPDNIFEINYNEEISIAMREGNYRLAVRLHFLRLLKNLAEKNAIQYKEDATNFDYLLQLKNSTFYNGFFKVTRYYEYAWYGGFMVNEELYRTIKNDFDSLDAQLGKY
jgi:hypothetical protein